MPPIQMRAEPDRATLTLMGVVGWEITPEGVARALKDAGDKPLTISLHSGGGDALAGIAIHNMLARHKGKKTVVIEGFAASAASLIAMAGDRIVMPANAFLMIHEAWGGAMGDAEQMRGTADLLDSISAAYRSTYAKRSGLDEDEVAALMRAETWFTAAEAVAKGLATEEAEPAEIVASVNPDALKAFRNVPAALATLARAPTPPAPPAQQKEVRMPDDINPAGGLPVANATPPAATLAELRGIAARGHLDNDWVVAQLEAGQTVAAAMESALDRASALSAEATIQARVNAAAAGAPSPVQSVIITRDAGDTLRGRLSGAFSANVLATARGIAPDYANDQREFAGLGFHALIRELMAARGAPNVHRLDGTQLIEAMFGGGVFANSVHTTSDFAGVLANTLNKTVRELYMAMPNTWSSWCDEVEVADYKQITAATIGQVSEVLAMTEGGPVIAGTIAEDPAETYQVSERGVLLPIGKQALVNDDTRALARAAQNLSLGAYTGLRRAVFGILTANANMADGVALFNAGHANLGTAGAISAANLGALIALLDAQSGPTRAGRPAASLPPTMSAALITGTNNRRLALELLGATVVPTTIGNALPLEMRAMMNPVFDPLLNGASTPQAYYAARTEPGLRPVEIAYIRGQRMPQITQAERIDYTGITFRCLFDFGAKAVTWRTAAANLG